MRINFSVAVKSSRSYLFLFPLVFSLVAACSPGAGEENRYEGRIFLKDLTTGVAITSEKFPKHQKVASNQVVFDYDFFGAARTVWADLNEDGRVIQYKLQVDESLFSFKSVIEDKLSSEGKKSVKFSCDSEYVGSGDFSFKSETCRIVSGGQVLSLVGMSPRSYAATNVTGGNSVTVILSEKIKLTDATEMRLNRERAEKYEMERKERDRKVNDI